MVAKKVEVISKKYGSDQGYTWVSEVSDGYEIFETNVSDHGTTIKLYLKDNTKDENYDEYLNQYHLRDLVKKYSDYVHYPIKMDMTVSKKKEDSDEYEDVVEKFRGLGADIKKVYFTGDNEQELGAWLKFN